MLVAGFVVSIAIAAVVALCNGERALRFRRAALDAFLYLTSVALDFFLRLSTVVFEVLRD